MEQTPEDISIQHSYLGPRRGSSILATHLPTGLWVAEAIPAGSTESVQVIQARLVSALELKIARAEPDA